MSWRKVKLGELCNIEKGNIGITKAIAGEYPLVVTSEERKSHNEYQFDDEAVVIPLVSSTGHGHKSLKRIHYQEGKFAVGNILCTVIPKDKSVLNAHYLYRYLDLNRENELVSRMKGMANVTLPMKEIASIEIPLPDIEEQIKFIERINSVEEIKDELLTEQETQLNYIKNLRQQILKDAMRGKLVPQNTKDERASKLFEKIKAEKSKSGKKEKPLPEIKPEEIPFDIPEGWVWCRLGEICNYGSSPKAEPKYLNENTWVLDLEDIEKETSKLLCKVRFAERNSLSTKSIFKRNEVLYSKLRPYLDKVIIADEGGVCTTEILPLKPLGNINPYFLKYALKRPDFLLYVNGVTKGMKMPRLGTKEGQLAIIPLPPLPEQKRIVSKIEELMTLCDELEASVKANQDYTNLLYQTALKEALQPKAIEEKQGSLAIATEPSESYGKIAKLPVLQEQEEKHFLKRKVLATYIINQSLNDTKFGDVKFEKLLHLSDYFAIKRNLGQKYYQQAAGPYDNAFTHQYFQQVLKAKWFNRNKKGNQFVFSAGQNQSKSTNTYGYFSEDELNRINEIIGYFKKSDYEQPEIVSTLYAVWNNRIILQQEISDDLLIEDFYNWDEQKKKYEHNRLEKALQWMRSKNFVPDGWGNVIEKPKAKKRKTKFNHPRFTSSV